MYDLGNVYFYAGRYPQAEDMYRRVAEQRRRAPNVEVRKLIDADLSLGAVFIRENRLDEAEPIMRAGLDRARQVLGNGDELTIQTAANLSSLYYAQKRYDEALPLPTEAADARQRLFGADDQRTLNSKYNLATILDKLDRNAEAEVLYQTVWDAQRQVLGRRHVKLGRFSEGASLISSAYDVLQSTLGSDSSYTIRTAERGVELYEKWGKSEQPLKWRTRLPNESSTKNAAR